ncbi:acyl-CoA dehydrogenase family protein [Mycobacterium sp.]|uniref:acyl-CoA dehydrogenase family protein n=1 Tax=Mycobacterium sp. TaxID=1785 RepID=UPI003C779FC4
MTMTAAEKLLEGAKPVSPVMADPELSPNDLVARAAALRERFREQQADTEARTFYSQDLHQAIEDAGLYRVYVPRKYGGYEFELPTFVRVVIEVARGCMSSGWCYALAAAHALQVAAWWPEQAQDEIFNKGLPNLGDFRAAGVAAPVGPLTKTSDGWSLTGRVSFASGIPISTHYMGQALIIDDPKGPPRQAAFAAPRDTFDIVDDWGFTIGLKGSGSHTIKFDAATLPEHYVLENFDLLNPDVGNGTEGLRLHKQPIYAGRSMGAFVMTLAAVEVGGAYLALDEYERIIREKKTAMPPFRPRVLDPDFQRWYGEALTRIANAEAALLRCAERHMEICQRAADGGQPFTRDEDLLLCNQGREVRLDVWRVLTDIMVPTVGANALSNGEPMERVFRDLTTATAHRDSMLTDWFYGETARSALGLASGDEAIMPSRGPNAR